MKSQQEPKAPDYPVN